MDDWSRIVEIKANKFQQLNLDFPIRGFHGVKGKMGKLKVLSDKSKCILFNPILVQHLTIVSVL